MSFLKRTLTLFTNNNGGEPSSPKSPRTPKTPVNQLEKSEVRKSMFFLPANALSNVKSLAAVEAIKIRFVEQKIIDPYFIVF